MMDNKGYGNIPRILFDFITFLSSALPLRSVPTFIELVIGAMITQAGFVTQAWLAISPVRDWTSYYKWLQRGKWSWVALGVQMTRLILKFFVQPVYYLIIDDTLIYRSSQKAPGCMIHHQHGSKPNRPRYVRGQCWVSLAFSLRHGMKSVAIPLLSKLMRVGGNSSKLKAAQVLLRVVAPIFENKKVVVLLDSWYMRWPLLQFLLKHGLQAIGQVRRDTALYDVPTRTGKRGRPRIYGIKYTPEIVDTLPEHRECVMIYGKEQWVRYRSARCLARFMKAWIVRAVWMQIEDQNGKLTGQRLLLSTNPELSAVEVITSYARRWPIEDLFNQMKNRWGWKEAWQQSRQVLHRWTQILSIGFALPQLLNIVGGCQVESLANIEPWRSNHPLTAGRIRLGLQRIFQQVSVRQFWNPKSRKFKPPNQGKNNDSSRNGPLQQIFMMSKNNFNETKTVARVNKGEL
jgi:hypothetical protein